MSITANKPSTKELREFGLITGSIVAVLFGLLLPWLFSAGYPLWPWIVAVVLSVSGLVLPRTLTPVYRGWMAFGHVMGWINTRIILGIMFYLIVMPTGLIIRLFGKDTMQKKRDLKVSSYRVVNPEPKKNHFERPF